MKKHFLRIMILIISISTLLCSFADNKRTFKDSYLESHNGIKVLHLHGSPYEMGQAMGGLLKDEIHALINGYIKSIFPNKKIYQSALKRARLLSKKVPEEYLQELKGMSNTSEIDFNDLLIANTFLDMKESALCSTFVVHKGQSAISKLMFGRNLEFKSLGILHKYDLIVVYHLKNKHPFISITWPGLIGVVTGYNQYGLTSAMLVSMSERRKANSNMPSTLAFRQLLETQKTIPDSINYFRETKIASPNNLTVTDSKNRSIVFELSPTSKFTYRKPKNNNLSCTNYFLKIKPAPLKPRDRYLKSVTKQYQKSNRRYSIEDLKEILNKAAIQSINIQSMIFIPLDGKLYLSMEELPAVSGHYQEIDLKDFFN